MTELCQLALKYGSDKVPQIKHSYTPFYHEIFKDKRNEVKKVLEIGIGYKECMLHSKNYVNGASLYMWRDYFPYAQIYGADVNDDILFQDDRITTFGCDQNDAFDLDRLLEKTGTDIDLLVDDGSHLLPHQIFTARYLRPKLSGIYIVEDVNSSQHLKAALKEFQVRLQRFHRRGDDCLAVIT